MTSNTAHQPHSASAPNVGAHQQQQQQQQQPQQQQQQQQPDRRVNVMRSRGLPAGPLQLLVPNAFLKSAVKKPAGVNLNHWLSTHTVDFYQLTTVLYSTLHGVCTADSCACMNCGSTFEYLWRDPGARPMRLSAPEYVDRLAHWIVNQLTEENFPTSGTDYPEDFQGHVKNIFRRLFRVYAHAYTSHYDSIVELGVSQQFDTAFIHFMNFASEFDLISVMELKPAKDLLFAVCEDIAAEKFSTTAAAET